MIIKVSAILRTILQNYNYGFYLRTFEITKISKFFIEKFHIIANSKV